MIQCDPVISPEPLNEKMRGLYIVVAVSRVFNPG